MADLLHNEFAADSIEGKDLDHLFHPTTNLKQHHEVGPSVHERAQGVYMWDSKGNQYLEGMSGLWCCNLGYSQERIKHAVAE